MTVTVRMAAGPVARLPEALAWRLVGAGLATPVAATFERRVMAPEETR